MPSPLPRDVDAWIDRQPGADRPDLRRTWALAGLAEPEARAPLAADTDAAWDRLAHALGTDAASPETSPPPGAEGPAASTRARPPRPPRPPAARAPRRWLVGALSVAALAVVVVGVGLSRVTVRAESEVAEVSLPDGSTAILAPGSEASYRRGLWGSARRVTLAGQALFDIEADGRPFQVETFNATVEVLGTVFDVRAWARAPAPETAVVLVEGAVRLRGRAGPAVVLRPGQTSRVGRGAPSAPEAADVDAATAWRSGGFAVSDSPLGAVAAALGARFGRTVRLGPGVDPSQRLTLYLPHAETADAVLLDVAAYLDLRLVAHADRYDLLAR